MSNYSEKLGIFREKLIDMLHIHYPDYTIGIYGNGLGRIPWLSVIDRSTTSRVVEVISVEKFGPEDTMGDTTLLVIDYVSSDSNTYKNIDLALDDVKSILTTASEKKKEANKNNVNDILAEYNGKVVGSLKRSDTIDPEKIYLVTGRCNGKTLFMQNLLKNVFGFKIKDVIFNNPATIVFWEDGEKTVVQCQNGEEFDPEKGLAMAISKRVYGNKHTYYEIFKKWIGKYNKKKSKTEENDPVEFVSNGHRYIREDMALNLVNQALDEASGIKNPREGISFQDYLAQQMKDPEFKKQYENTEVIEPEDDNK